MRRWAAQQKLVAATAEQLVVQVPEEALEPLVVPARQ